LKKPCQHGFEGWTRRSGSGLLQHFLVAESCGKGVAQGLVRHRPSQRLIAHPRIDLRRRNLAMAERPLDEVQVAGLVVEMRGEGVRAQTL